MPEAITTTPELRITIFGPLAIEVDGAPLSNLAAVKARALLVYLAVVGGRHTRSSLAGLLWSDVDESSARTSLRTALSQLRKAVGDVVVANRQAVWLDPSAPLWFDCHAFNAACKQLEAGDWEEHDLDELRAAIHLYRNDFLAGFHVPDAALFEEWQIGQREHYRRTARRALVRLAEIAERSGALTQALDDVRRVLTIDPLRESAHRQVMRLLARQGDRSAALVQFARCRQLLADELGVEPDPATVALADSIRNGTVFSDLAETASFSTDDLSVDAILAPPPLPEIAPPFMVPPRPPQGIFGREALLASAFELLDLNEDEPEHGAPVALQGMGGIGKTTSAIAVGRHAAVTQAFPDGVLWASVGPVPTVRNLLDDWGRALGLDLIAERDEAACAERLRSALHAKRTLLIVDDIWDISHAAHFMVAGPRCRTLLTTRESPIAHALTTRGKTLRIDVLAPNAALDLLDRLAPEAIAADAESARRLCQRLEFLPLALTLAGRMLANEADVPSRMQRLLGELLERREARLQLLQAEGRLGLSSDEPVSLQSVLGMSIARLQPADQERFAMLAVFGAEPLVWEIEAAAHVWECSQEQAEETVSRFIQRGLVMRREDQYWTHALLADYAAEMLEAM